MLVKIGELLKNSIWLSFGVAVSALAYSEAVTHSHASENGPSATCMGEASWADGFSQAHANNRYYYLPRQFHQISSNSKNSEACDTYRYNKIELSTQEKRQLDCCLQGFRRAAKALAHQIENRENGPSAACRSDYMAGKGFGRNSCANSSANCPKPPISVNQLTCWNIGFLRGFVQCKASLFRKESEATSFRKSLRALPGAIDAGSTRDAGKGGL